MLSFERLKKVDLGFRGENNARYIDIDVSKVLQQFPDAVFTILHRRSGETEPYSVETELTDGVLRWVITDTDTEICGYGEYEVIASHGDSVLKSSVGATYVAWDIKPREGDITPSGDIWLDRMQEERVIAVESARHAEQKAQEADQHAQAANAAKEAAETIRTSFEASATQAQTHATAADNSRYLAQTAQTNAEGARDAAESHSAAAQSARADAQAAATASAASAAASAQSEQNAAASAADAATSATSAHAAKSDAQEAAAASDASATASANSATEAAASASDAQAAKLAAEASASDAAAEASAQVIASTIDDERESTERTWSSEALIERLTLPFEVQGNPATCFPVEGSKLGVKVQVLPVQEGNGEPSPDNIRPISMPTSVTVEHNGDSYTVPLPEGFYGGELDIGEGKAVKTFVCRILRGSDYWAMNGNVGFYTASTQGKLTPNTYLTMRCSHYRTATSGDFRVSAARAEPFIALYVYDSEHAGNLDAWRAYVEAQYAAGTPIVMCYEVESTEVDGEQLSITAQSGTNTLSTDAQSLTVTGREDPLHVIAEMEEQHATHEARLAALEAALIGG